MRSRLIIISIFMVLLIVIGVLTDVFTFRVVDDTKFEEQQLILEKVEAVGKLELVKYNFNDVVEQSVVRKFLDFDKLAPDSKVILIINGEATACINLKEINEKDIEVTESNISITLPQPEICYSKVNHNKSKIYDANLTARLLNPELIDEGFKNAENRIKSEAVNLGIIDEAKVNAKKILLPLLQSISKKTIQLKYKDEN